MAKILVTLKDPDAVCDALEEHINRELADNDLPLDEQDALREVRKDRYKNIVDEWFEYGEYVTLEFDTDTKSARVLTAKEAGR